MEIHHLKLFAFLLLLSSINLSSCKQDAPVNTVKKEVMNSEETMPEKRISEQYSDSDYSSKEKPAEPILTTQTSNPKDAEAKVEQIKTEVKMAAPIEKKKVVTVAKPKTSKNQVKARYPELEFDELSYDFGEIMQGDKIDHKFTFTNTGRAPLSITKADATCGCATPSIPFMDIMPGEKGYIGVSYNSVGKEGEEYPQVTIFSNAKTNPNQVLKLSGFVKVPSKDSTAVDSLQTAAKDTVQLGN